MIEFWDGSGISWTICKQSARRSRQITTPTPHHSIFTGWMLFLMPDNSVTALLVMNIHTGHVIVTVIFVRSGQLSVSSCSATRLCIHRQQHTQLTQSTANSYLQAGCSSCSPTNSVKALKACRHTRLMALFPGLPR